MSGRIDEKKGARKKSSEEYRSEERYNDAFCTAVPDMMIGVSLTTDRAAAAAS